MAMTDNGALRQKVRELIQAGTLPDRPPDRMWGGPGGGGDCTICGAQVKRDEVEFEIEFARNGEGTDLSRYHVHLRCFTAWDAEGHTLERARKADSSGDQT
jgi:hypothetical protein